MVALLRLTSGLLLIAPAALFLIAIGRRQSLSAQASRTVLVFVYAMGAAAPLLLAFLWRLDATRIVIELRGVAFRTEGRAPIKKQIVPRTRGGGVAIEEWKRNRGVASAAYGTLTFRPGTPGTQEKGALTIEEPAPARRAGLIGTKSDGLLGSMALEDGDLICIGGSCWAYSERGRAFTRNGRVLQLPARQAKLPGIDWIFELPWAPPVTAALRTYALDFLARQEASTYNEHVRSFLCYADPERRLRLVVLDANVVLLRHGAAVAAPSTFTIPEVERVSLYGIPRESATFAAPGVAERRSMRFQPGARSFVFAFDTPEVHSVTVDEFRALQLERKKDDPSISVPLTMGNSLLIDRSLYFAGIGESVALQATSIFEMSRFFPRDFYSTFRIASPRGPTEGTIGNATWIGASSLASVRLDVIRPPLLLLTVGIVIAGLKIAAAAGSRFTVAQCLFAGTLEALVGMRLLLGYRVWAMPPNRFEAAELGMVAWIILPWIFIAASLPAPPPHQRAGAVLRRFAAAYVPAGAGILISCAFCLRLVEGPRKWVWFACQLTAILIAFLRVAILRKWIAGKRQVAIEQVKLLLPRARPALPAPDSKPVEVSRPSIVPRAIAGAAVATAIWFVARLAAGPIATIVLTGLAFAAGAGYRELKAAARPLFHGEMNAIVAWSALLMAGRFVLLLFGAKESLTVAGSRIALSAIYVPAAVLIEAEYFRRAWRRAARTGGLQWSDWTAAAVLLLLVWIIPAGMTSDIGLALLNIPVFTFLLLSLHRHTQIVRSRWVPRTAALRVLPWALAGGVLLFLAGAPALRLLVPLSGNEEFMLKLASDSNYARFLHFAAPEQLQELATKRGESLAITSATLQAYISSGFFGRGYGHSEVSPYLADTALRDFAPAVFVACEWGLAGTLSLLMLYGTFLATGYYLAPWKWRSAWGPATRQAVIGGSLICCVAAATFALASIYMILANHELLLLTGKNAYLFGLDSAGDLLESIVLVLMIAYGAAVSRDGYGSVMRSGG